MITVHLIRGLPGSGKTTRARALYNELDHGGKLRSADDFFMVNGVYRFDPTKLGEAHAACQAEVGRLLYVAQQSNMEATIIVHNTFTQKWEMSVYYTMARLCGANVIVTDLFDAGLTDERLFQRNVHGVPLEQIARMRARYER